MLQTNHITIILGMIAFIMLFSKLPKLPKPNGRKERAELSISVIIPARNEENNISNLLNDLMKQTYRIHEIICVNDDSEDKTPLIIEDFSKRGRIKVRGIEAGDLPQGWKGKPWACQNGAKAAEGEVLLFIDADVRLSENAVEILVNRHFETGKPLSVQPYHTVKKEYENGSLFFNLIQTCATGMSIWGIKKTEGFYGPVLLIQKNLFDRHGGYESARNIVIEDFNLGKYLSKQGVDIELYLGWQTIRYRMYPDSFRCMLEGWSKNISTASLSMKRWLLIVIVTWIACLTILPFEILRSAGTVQLVLSLIYLLCILLIYRAARSIGSYKFRTCLFYPIYLFVFHLIFFYSMIATYIFKTTTWKGRKL